MLKKIVGTTGTRLLNAVINLIILLLITNKIGSEGFGVIALIMVSITIIQMLVDLVSGSALIYFSSRANIGQLLFPSYLWIGLVISVFYALSIAIHALFPVLYVTIIPPGYEIHIFTLALLNALMITHYNLLIGREEIKIYNIIFSLQIVTMLVTFLLGIFMLNDHSPLAYVHALYMAYAIGGILAFLAVLRNSGQLVIKGWMKILSQVVRFGFISFVANILNVGNKRISFYVLRYFTGLSALGIYNAGVQLTEGLRIIGQSISLVQFSTISNTNSIEYARTLTIKLMKFTVVLTLMAVLVLLLIPESVYTFIFSKDFTEVKPIIVALSPGVIALAANNIFSHYFSGLGNPKVNMWANLVGLVFTLVLAFTLIPAFGYIGAAVTASVSYISSVVYQYFIFKRDTSTKFKEWIPVKKDATDFMTLTRDVFKKKVQQ